jgi:hypothetical protein
MFALARSTITTLVAFGLPAWFDVKRGEASSSVRRAALTWYAPRFMLSNGSASRRRRRRPGRFRSRKF